MKPVIIIAILFIPILMIGFSSSYASSHQELVEKEFGGDDRIELDDSKDPETLTILLVIGTFIAVGVAYLGNRRAGKQLEKQNEITKTGINNQVIFKILDNFTDNEFSKNRRHVYSFSRKYRKLKKNADNTELKEEELKLKEEGYVKSSFHQPTPVRVPTGELENHSGEEICRKMKTEFGEIAAILKINPQIQDKIFETYGDTISLSWRAIEPEIELYRKKFDERHMTGFENMFRDCKGWYEKMELKMPPLF